MRRCEEFGPKSLPRRSKQLAAIPAHTRGPPKKKKTYEKTSGPKRATTQEQSRPQALTRHDQAVELTDKQIERILQWWNITERYAEKAKRVE